MAARPTHHPVPCALLLTDLVTHQASGIVLPSEDDTDASAFSPVLRCPTVGHWQVGRNGAYGYNHQYLGDAESPGIHAKRPRQYR